MNDGPGHEISHEALRGLWERELITYYDGRTDSSKKILWMQARTIYADIRVPRAQPAFRSSITHDTLTADEMVLLSRCAGFGGTIGLQGSTCEWVRSIDWQPFSGVDDVATLSLDGPDLIEDGGACGGHQIWRRRSAVSCPSLGLLLQDRTDGRSGVLVALDDCFIYVRGRVDTLPPAVDLEALLRKQLDEGLDGARALFDAEVSYGSIDENGILGIQTSTLPWRVGDALATRAQLIPPGDTIEVNDRGSDGSQARRTWRVVEVENDGFLTARSVCEAAAE